MGQSFHFDLFNHDNLCLGFGMPATKRRSRLNIGIVVSQMIMAKMVKTMFWPLLTLDIGMTFLTLEPGTINQLG